MSEQTGVTNVTGESNEQGKEASKEFQAITSQEDFDAAIQARIARERAKFPDYDELKAKAEKFAEWENSQKTEAEKQKEALEVARRELAEARLVATRAQVAASKGVPAELLSGSTQEELEASASALIAFKGQQADPRLVVPTEGRTVTPGSSTADQFASFIGDKL
ncbi:hypothetical protein GCM10009651_36410 [Microbacterium natoriense]|uniref:capsid assembly scaffolding protein Gp46 family protein n=1 Tax=Microbacterium natoriense TaxID=284570 RepID=UPI0031D0A2DE